MPSIRACLLFSRLAQLFARQRIFFLFEAVGKSAETVGFEKKLFVLCTVMLSEGVELVAVCYAVSG